MSFGRVHQLLRCSPQCASEIWGTTNDAPSLLPQHTQAVTRVKTCGDADQPTEVASAGEIDAQLATTSIVMHPLRANVIVLGAGAVHPDQLGAH